MKLNVIHLPHRADRMETLLRELERQQISNYQIWDGVLDQEMPCRGIAQAHKQIVRDAKENGASMVLIGEDDLRFTDIGAFQFYLNSMPKDFDLYLGGIYFGTLNDQNTVGDFTGLTLYIVHEKFYGKFLDLPEDKNIDRAMNNTGGKFVVCNPFVVIQYDGYSDNQQKAVNYNNILMNRKFYNIFWNN